MTQNEVHTDAKKGWSEEDLRENPHSASDKAKRVEAMFTEIARKYDLNNRLHSIWQDQKWRKKAVMLSSVSKDDVVIDVACGTGDLAMAFKTAGAKSVIGIDFTKAMLDIAVRKSRIADIEIDYRQGDAMDLDISENSADIVSIAFGIRNVEQPKKAILEFFRVLKPGGRLVILEFSTPSNAAVRFMNNVYTKRIMPITATLISQDTSGAYRYLPKSVETFSDAEELANLIEQCGFTSIRQFPQTFGVCTITLCAKEG